MWDEIYETGNEIVDNEHKEIFTLVEKVLSATFEKRSKEIDTTIDFLTDYVVEHFLHEEQLCDECSYPDSSVHKAQHANFAQNVGKLVERIATHENSLNISLEINKTIVDWLTDHIMKSDKALADYYRNWKERM